MSFPGTGVVSASGGDGACVPYCTSCKEKRRCVRCLSGYYLQNYQCKHRHHPNDPLVCIYVFNPYKPIRLFMGHQKTVNNQIRCRRMRPLIRIYTVC